MTVSEGPGEHNTRIVKKKYPSTKGLTAGTTKTSGRKHRLVPESKTLIRKRSIQGL